MNSTNSQSNFDRLASNISKQERTEMLGKLKPEDMDIKIPDDRSARADHEFEKLSKEELKNALTEQLSHESFFLKFIVWLKSVFMNQTSEEVYNNTVVSHIAKDLERIYPGLLDYRHRILGSQFFNRLKDLKNSQEFFRKACEESDEHVGAFYFMLGTILIPDIVQEIKNGIDPYRFPLTKAVSPDTRNVLLNDLDNLLSGIPEERKRRMALCAASFEWLRAFCRLPISSVMTKFTVIDDIKSCMFSQIRSDFSQMTKLLSNTVAFPEEMLRTLFCNSVESRHLWDFNGLSDPADSLIEKVHSSSAEVSSINMFITSVPMRNLGKVIFENSLYSPEIFCSNDSWFQKYRDEWKNVFDHRWRQWNRDVKKEAIKKKMKLYFGVNDFQKFPYHPWERVSEEAPFSYDLSIGFLNYYFKQEFPKFGGFLNVVTLEGDFSIKENRLEFNDVSSDFNGLVDMIDILASKLGSGGDYGTEFVKYDTSLHGTNDVEKIRVVVSDIEENAFEIIDLFSKSSIKLQNLLVSMTGEKTSPAYGPLSNLNKIMGRENKKFRETLERFGFSLKYSLEVLDELRAIDKFIL